MSSYLYYGRKSASSEIGHYSLSEDILYYSTLSNGGSKIINTVALPSLSTPFQQILFYDECCCKLYELNKTSNFFVPSIFTGTTHNDLFIFFFKHGELVSKSSFLKRETINQQVNFDGTSTEIGLNLLATYKDIFILPTTTCPSLPLSDDANSYYCTVSVTTHNFLLSYQYLNVDTVYTVNVNFNFTPQTGELSNGYPAVGETIHEWFVLKDYGIPDVGDDTLPVS